MAIDLKVRTVYLSKEDPVMDGAAFKESFIERQYVARFKGATVVDLGAHKGYFGAYALVNGAATVLSYEPESRNFSYLARAASGPDRGQSWVAHHCAVGSVDGEAMLKVARGSWSHSFLTRDVSTGEEQNVEVRSLDRILVEAALLDPDWLIVKIDIEGSECDVVLHTNAGLWRIVDEVLVEHHNFAPCTWEELMERFTQLGFVAPGEVSGDVHRLVRDPPGATQTLA